MKTKACIIFFYCIIIALFSCRKKELPPATCKICCKVTDSNNIPVDSAKIDFKESGITIAQYTYTQSNGIVYIDKLEPGSYHFTISKKGYSYFQQDIDVADEQQNQNFIINKIIALFGKDTIVDKTVSSATILGFINDLGYWGYVTQYGHCWSSTNNNPTIYDSKTTLGTLNHPFQFSSVLTGLSPNTTYYIKAYATNSIGTVYNNMLSFSTQSLTIPTVTTTTITNIMDTAAISGGNVITDGSIAVTARGVCWSTNQLPTTSDSHTTNGTGTGSFTSNITGLIGTTKYYVRAYATNSIGTAYGNQVSFTTLFNCGIQTVTDIDGNTYNTIKIGSQCWFKKNLEVLSYSDGSSIVSDWWYYNNDSNLNSVFGKLYDWHAVNNSHGLCPIGWHVPSDAEWTTLTNFLGGETVAGGALKSITGWGSTNVGATNSSGFTALPGGYRRSGSTVTFYGAGSGGNWWTSTEDVLGTSYYRYLGYDNSAVFISTWNMDHALSIRCLQN